jgi:MYXO-CTERM domain-containing protein
MLLLALGLALAVGLGAVLLLKEPSDRKPSGPADRGTTVGTSGALLVVIIVLAASSRRRRRRDKEGRDDG